MACGTTVASEVGGDVGGLSTRGDGIRNGRNRALNWLVPPTI
jgi:hypothetical protein